MIHSIAFAPSDFLTAVHGGGSLLGARLSACTNMLLPLHKGRHEIVSAYARFDAVVTDHNPFLAAISLRRLVEQGKSCLLVQSGDNDDWPYDLLFSTPIGSLLASLSAQEAGFEDDPLPVPTRLVTEYLRPFASRITVTRSYGGVHLANRQPSGSLALFGNQRQLVPETDIGALLGSLRATLHNVLFYSPRLRMPSWGRLAIFTDELVLTGRPHNFGQSMQVDDKLEWGSRRISAMGSAQFANRTNPEAAHKMLEEIVALHEMRRSLKIR
jgi:hypothetical protein